MKSVVFICLVGYAASAQYVWDLLKPPLNVAEVQAILSNSRADGSQFPMYNDVPQTNFDCGSKRQPGFYADISTGCQIFHRCDINGNFTSYLCVNSTVFNQITLVCDYFFNVDCERFGAYENFANSRLYQEPSVPLFDSPRPEENYVPAYLLQQALTGVQATQQGPIQTQIQPAAQNQGQTQNGANDQSQTGVQVGQGAQQIIASNPAWKKRPAATTNGRATQPASIQTQTQESAAQDQDQAQSQTGTDDQSQSGVQVGQGAQQTIASNPVVPKRTPFAIQNQSQNGADDQSQTGVQVGQGAQQIIASNPVVTKRPAAAMQGRATAASSSRINSAGSSRVNWRRT